MTGISLQLALSTLVVACALGLASSVRAESVAGRALVESTCGLCHTLERGRGAAEGPNLFGVVGRSAGTAENYAYTPAFRRALAGKVWTPELLEAFLTDTGKVAPGSGMTYFSDDAGMRAAIIEYLSTLK